MNAIRKEKGPARWKPEPAAKSVWIWREEGTPPRAAGQPHPIAADLRMLDLAEHALGVSFRLYMAQGDLREIATQLDHAQWRLAGAIRSRDADSIADALAVVHSTVRTLAQFAEQMEARHG